MGSTETAKAVTERRVRVLVFHRDRPGHPLADTLDLTDHEVVIADGPQADDVTAWTAWIQEYAGKWLTAKEPLAPGSYRALAVDPASAHLAGFEGYRCLSQEIELAYVAP